MKSVVVHPLPTLTAEIVEESRPVPKSTELLIKVVVAGSNVKDWSHITALKLSCNSGDDLAGIVAGMGDKVMATGEFRLGDRVAAFHEMLKPHGAYAEYAIAPASTAFIIPDTVTFEAAATIPLVTLTAGISLFRRQRLPAPWAALHPSGMETPLIVYGASSALGTFAIKLARAANIHPIIAIAGSSKEYVAGFLDPGKGDAVVDYRQGIQGWKTEVKELLTSTPSNLHALDAISANDSWIPVAQLLDELYTASSATGTQRSRPMLSVVSGANSYDGPHMPQSVDILYTYVGTAHYGTYKPGMPKQPNHPSDYVPADIDFAYVLLRYVAKMLSSGAYEGHPYDVVPGGLGGVEKGLNRLKNGNASGKKLVYRIRETAGLAEE